MPGQIPLIQVAFFFFKKRKLHRTLCQVYPNTLPRTTPKLLCSDTDDSLNVDSNNTRNYTYHVSLTTKFKLLKKNLEFYLQKDMASTTRSDSLEELRAGPEEFINPHPLQIFSVHLTPNSLEC